MKQVKPLESFLDADKELSLFDIVLPLLKMSERGVPEEHLGSCFPIGIGLYATAAHVFEPFMQARHRYKPFDRRSEPPSLEEKLARQRDMVDSKLFEGVDVNCGALVLDQAAIREGTFKPLGFSLARHVVIFLDDDLALLFLHEDKRRNVRSLHQPLNVLPIVETPKGEEEIIVTGFPGRHNRFEIGVVDVKLEGAARLGLVASEGKLSQLHDVKRDEGQCFYPCIETTASMLHGDSGGPAISKERCGVVGVNSAGLDSPGYSVVSWTGKALDWDFELPFDLTLGSLAIPAGQPVSLRRMAEAKVIFVV